MPQSTPRSTLFHHPSLTAGDPIFRDVMPDDALAIFLSEAAASSEGGWIHVCAGETRAERLAATAASLGAGVDVHLFRPWECLPYDRSSPSAEIMGSRVAVLLALAEADPGAGTLVIATGEALVQKVPPPAFWTAPGRQARLELENGAALSLQALRRYLLTAGYTLDVQVDEPGHATLRPTMIDLFPAADSLPVRIELQEGLIHSIHRFDPATQRTTEEAASVVLTPASELLLDPSAFNAVLRGDEAPGTQSFLDQATLARQVNAAERPRAGMEHWLPAFAGPLASLLDYLPGAALSLGAGVEGAVALWREQIADGFTARSQYGADADAGTHPLLPDQLYQPAEALEAVLSRRRLIRFHHDAAEAIDPVPNRLPVGSDPARRTGHLASHVRTRLEAGERVIVALERECDRSEIRRALGRGFPALPAPVPWSAALTAEAGERHPGEKRLTSVLASLRHGFAIPGTIVVSEAALLGTRPEDRAVRHPSLAPELTAGEEIGPGDLVVHEEHGIGRVIGLDALEGEVRHDCLVLEYAGGDRLLVPVEEMDRVWRYGSEGANVALDHLRTRHWAEHRAMVEAAIAETAEGLAAEARRRAALSAPVMKPGRQYQRFTARFPYTLTVDQEAAIEAVLGDLSSGHPMDRLICGDVGFGKTEVALRAASVAAYAGFQVALIAPTTVLARQHLDSFRARFADLGVRVEGLSRLTRPAQAREVEAGIADGSIGIAVGTSALAAERVRFAKLGLVIIDEEQRFGEKDKAHFRRLGAALPGGGGHTSGHGEDQAGPGPVHTLVMTATPIPRTLQSALVGAQAFSILATPPARRQPVRTFVVPYDGAVLLEALQREVRRGGQSFVVCPRIDDLAPLEAELGRLVPELRRVTAHGKMKAAELDEVMIGFARGDADVLLATNIIEAGLDIPNANMMAVWRADRFGMAQLHQLRGRVGRGRRRAAAYLFTEAGKAAAPATLRRLKALETMDRLGAGFAVSARDLDQRGAGDLLGEDQAGHVRLIGTELYQTLLAAAVRRAKGKDGGIAGREAPRGALHSDATALSLGLDITIPSEYVPDEAVRVSLFRRIARAEGEQDLDDLAAEIADRFGPLPASVETLLHMARLRRAARALGVTRIEAGPRGIAATLGATCGAKDLAAAEVHLPHLTASATKTGEPRLVLAEPTPPNPLRLDRTEALLEALRRVRFGG